MHVAATLEHNESKEVALHLIPNLRMFTPIFEFNDTQTNNSAFFANRKDTELKRSKPLLWIMYLWKQ